MQKNSSIELVHFSDEHSAELNEFELPAEQSPFTALPKDVLTDASGQHPIVILNEGTPVGFFILHATERVKNYSENPKAMLLTALSIDDKRQGRGFGKKAMLKLPEWISREFSHCDEVVLAVNQKNTAAQHLYLKTGFVDTGERKMGPIGEQIVMSLKVK
ncbi:GNAT family N-acetyltransferase [Bacillus swezeyi]|uniref:GNAT family N-acetyltransferase n=1 Tax=Bacillus swezeyi TaxID=1925020 RepID=A0A5M8RQ99_9BACI|nr:GNAT family N-acetyltransferase [Bacillus swezeyi]KAA6450767.1 GNAT family N-acetyltransferase [Bacillus swezeyi]KAA6475032.1 GNAT family N-acetyltransferase [Bacillus swezeyi]TYS37303.1 GNAT family N-acetyltransferase [Bacillus swezeyi]